MRHSLLALILTVMAPGVALAADRCAGTLSADQIRDCLAGPAPVGAAPVPVAPPLTRGIRQGRGIAIEGEQAKARETSVNLTVNFEFNSARLSNDGMISLDALGQALSDPSLRDEKFRLAGHTDAVGSDDYNQRLSEARALAVRTYLAQHHQLDPSKFDVVGYGKSQLYDRDDPLAAVNRRVEVTKLSR
jgi:outer membrane protein OmpA-like peptidoglycan-associated protein